MLPKRILLVDDDATLLYALDRYLGSCGYDVHCATEGEQASALLINRQYDVVVVDVRLSALEAAEGLTLVQLIRERNLSPRVIVMTGSATDAVRAEASRLDVDCFLEKPVPLEFLAAILAELT